MAAEQPEHKERPKPEGFGRICYVLLISISCIVTPAYPP
jgi:hypothetical protein